MDPSTARLVAAAQEVRAAHTGSDQEWDDAIEALYEALAEVEEHLTPTLEKSSPPRRRPHWTNDLGLTTARSTSGASAHGRR